MNFIVEKFWFQGIRVFLYDLLLVNGNSCLPACMVLHLLLCYRMSTVILTQFMQKLISLFYLSLCKQLNIVEGKMQYLFDENGRRYLDAFAGIVTVSCGHCHPEVLNAIMEQSKLLQHATTIYLHHAIADFAEALASKMPGNLKVQVLQTRFPDNF